MIEHTGKIINIQEDTMEIVIQPSSACISCQVKGACSSADTSQKLLTVSRQNELSIGDEVLIKIKESQGYKAVIYAYGIPLLIMFTGLFLGDYISLQEWESAILSFVLLAAYYLAFYRWGKKLTKSFEFEVEKIKP